jgi:micrococcal nuclease
VLSKIAVRQLLACVFIAWCGPLWAGCDLELGPTRSVARVIDGETLALDDGSEVRLIGALSPRAMDAGAEPGQWPPERATVDALTTLVLGKSVTLGFSGTRTDRHGRLQAHVFVEDENDKVWVQGRLLQSGHARAYSVAGNRACQSELLGHERVARLSGAGLWRDAAYQVRRATPPWPLTTYRGTFQIIAGRVTRSTDSRDTSYLNFGDDGATTALRHPRRGFSVSIKRADRDILGAFSGTAKSLEGQMLEVRGWIENRSGPLIDISMAGFIADGSDAPQRTPRLPRRRASAAPPSPSAPGAETQNARAE